MEYMLILTGQASGGQKSMVKLNENVSNKTHAEAKYAE